MPARSSRAASALAWARPLSFRPGPLCPCHRPSRFQSVSPCRATNTRVIAPSYDCRPMDLRLQDACVLVTGGSAGIGLATCELLTEEGARVAMASRRPEAEAKRLGAVAVTADLATSEGCAAAVQEAA